MYYKHKNRIFQKPRFSDVYFPVVDLSKGGARFLSNDRFTPGRSIVVKFDIPGYETTPAIQASVRWISRNPEESYRYQTGIAFNPYGIGKKENPQDMLDFFEQIENKKFIEKTKKET